MSTTPTRKEVDKFHNELAMLCNGDSTDVRKVAWFIANSQSTLHTKLKDYEVALDSVKRLTNDDIIHGIVYKVLTKYGKAK